MHLTCPSCHDTFPIAAGFLEGDGKRLAALFAAMSPVLGRAVVGYLRLFKPPKQALRTARAVKLVAELQTLVDAGSVCRDERAGARRAATPAIWAEGIEQLLSDTAKLTLPLTNHHYLRAVVYGLADKADAATERQREADKKAGRHLATPSGKPDTDYQQALRLALSKIQGDLELGLIEAPEAERRRKDVRAMVTRPGGA